MSTRRPMPTNLSYTSHLLRMAPLLLVAALASGCVVGKGKYTDALDELERTQNAYDDTITEIGMCEARKAELASQLQAQTEATAETMQALDGCTQRAEALEGELANTRAMLEESGEEREELLRRIQELSAIEAEARERNRIYREVVQRFQAMIDAGELDVSIRDGRMVINLPQDILFDSGRAQVSEDGTATITRVAEVLAGLSSRRFQVEGHTDNVPISTARFPSNWELSAARAIAVLKILIATGVDPHNFSAAAYGEFQPRASNDTPEGRALNRRIEIVMIPNVEPVAVVTPDGDPIDVE